MDPMPKVSLEQILATIPPQGQGMLDHQVSDDINLAEIARALINWESVCAFLGINEAEQETIERDNQGTDAQRYV